MFINTFDIDGVINLEEYDGVYPGKNDFIITGRSIEEVYETIELLRNKGIHNQVFFNYVPFNKKTRLDSGKHKAFIINHLINSGFKIGLHFEDDEIQAQCIAENCPNIKVVLLKHELVNKENVRRKEQPMKKPLFLGVINPATTVSLCGLVSSFFAVISAFHGREKLALTFFILTPMFDFFDGVVARKTNKSEREFEFGGRLDPMLDLVNFSFAPAIMFYLLGYSSLLATIILIFFLLCGAERQGDPAGGSVDGYFTGMPIPYGIILMTFGWVIFKITGLELIFTFFLILTSILFILRFPFKKQAGIFLLIWPIIVVLSICLVWFLL